jgi:hypothetical protein
MIRDGPPCPPYDYNLCLGPYGNKFNVCYSQRCTCSCKVSFPNTCDARSLQCSAVCSPSHALRKQVDHCRWHLSRGVGCSEKILVQIVELFFGEAPPLMHRVMLGCILCRSFGLQCPRRDVEAEFVLREKTERTKERYVSLVLSVLSQSTNAASPSRCGECRPRGRLRATENNTKHYSMHQNLQQLLLKKTAGI